MDEGTVHFRPDQAPALQAAGDILEVGILSIDRSFTVTGWNRWLEDATGKSAGEIVGRPLSVVDPDLRPAASSALRRAMEGVPVVLSHRLHGYLIDIPVRHGTQRYARMQQNVRILPVFGTDGAPTGAVALIQDVSERVAREQELREAMEAAQSSNQAKSNFLAAMSHELRTPIGAISAYTDLLKDEILGPVTSLQTGHLLRIKTVASHLLGIVDEILTFARIEVGREVVRAADVDGVALMREAIIGVEPLMIKKGLELRASLPESVSMRTDPVKVRQILINLLGNAAKFTDRGYIAVSLALSPDGLSVVFRVADSGSGISIADQERIFEPFVQVSKSYSRSHEGTGLGLSVSRTLARLMGGDLNVESEPGVGSTFTVVLPR